MSAKTTTTSPGRQVVRPAIERPTAMSLAETEYQRVSDAVEALRPEHWSLPTDCTAWDVRQLVAADFCRIRSGRPGSDGAQPSGLLTTQIPY